MQLIIAEKPSVARDLARVLGVPPRGKSFFEGDGRVITWCVGHLVELEEPAAYDPRWKHWRLDTLPMIPARFKLRPATGAPEQFRAVRTLLRESRFREVVNACDAGREGELIFRYVYDLAGAALPVQRLWISSLTDEAIRRGFSALRPGTQYDGLADAARCRSEADWLVGMNATRAITASNRRGADGVLYSIGRVQTPTLGLLTAREEAIQRFVPNDYWEVRAALVTAAGERFHATWTHGKQSRLGAAAQADLVVARSRAHGTAADPLGPRVERVRTRTVREPPPLLFDLTSLQRTANSRYGLSAARTLEIAQALYEKHKVLTYPRTDARHLSADVAKELPRMFEALRDLHDYAPFARHLLAHPPGATKRVFDDAKVGDHHAIVPTGKAVRLESLDRDEGRIFDLVARRFLGAFYPDAEFANTEVVVVVGVAPPSQPPEVPTGEGTEAYDAVLPAAPPPPDRYIARGRVRMVAGWQEVAGLDGGDAASLPSKGAGTAPTSPREGERERGEPMLPKLREGERLGGAFDPQAKKTQPPHRYTEATLLGAMESAGKAIEDEALRLAMKDCGLGTPATRAAIIETLLKRNFVTRDKKQLVPTAMGMALIAALPIESLGSPELTGQWEARLARIARGQEARGAFMADIAGYVQAVVTAVRTAGPSVALPQGGPAGAKVGRCPRCGGDVVELSRGFACATGAAPCGFEIPKLVARRSISADLAKVLLDVRKTRVLRGFRSRAGKAFAAALVLDDGGAVRFAFESASAKRDDEGDREDSATEAPVAPVAPEPARAARRTATAEAPREAGVDAAVDVSALACPRCKTGHLITGKRGWGCSRWREQCTLVVWFEAGGKRITPAQLRELIERGKTRKGKWAPGNGPPVAGRLVLDPNAPGGAVRFELA